MILAGYWRVLQYPAYIIGLFHIVQALGGAKSARIALFSPAGQVEQEKGGAKTAEIV